MKHKTGRLSELTKGRVIFLVVTISILTAFVLARQKYAERALGSHIGYKKVKVDTNDTTKKYFVERVVDGDTLKLTNGERVRLIGIDTPESKPNDKAKRDSKRTGQDLEIINKMGQEATEFVKGFLKEGQEVRLEFDVQERDKYGRLLAYVFIEPKAWRDWPEEWHTLETPPAEVFLNATIIKAGYAQPMTIPPNVKYAELFVWLYLEDREQGRGLFSVQCKDDSQCIYTTEWGGHIKWRSCRSSRYWVPGEEKIDTEQYHTKNQCGCVEGKCTYKGLNKEAEGE